MTAAVTLILLLLLSMTAAYMRVPLAGWSAGVVAVLAVATFAGDASAPSLVLLWLLFIAVLVPLNLRRLRRSFLSDRLLAVFRRVLPAMSDTERQAIEAGSVWWEAQLFGGRPHWRDLLALPPARLSAEEQEFIDGPVNELCAMLDDWRISDELHDLPPEVWEFIKSKGFFGMIIPKDYGGLEFSARAHSEVVMKLATRSIAAAVTVMVPNSLGPAELLLHYGTQAQKDHYLRRLARGEDVPCFALTGPQAGSDAGAMPDTGVVCRGEFDGRSGVLGVRLNWEKRYITLGPVATVLGLAFRLCDPDHLLGPKEDLGITCALIPTDTPGVRIGERHDPLNIAFQNGPNSGEEVFIPVDWIIGGPERAGQGWRMLVERLAVGRGISLPALSTGAGKLASRATGAYARIRRQFKLPIGHFEGVEEALTRIAANTYLMDAARTLTATAVDQGEKPAVVSAIVKYHLTERMREVINDAMDVQGGSGICLGPRNLLGRPYQALPISITVEGANILTRSLIIYGQGAIRCHPFVLKEMAAAAEPDGEKASREFDRALFGHVGHYLSNAVRALALGLSHGALAGAPAGPMRRCYQHLSRCSAAFALVSDTAMMLLGGALKRSEKISGRLADALSGLYLASAVLKRYEDDGRPEADLPLVRWACADALWRIQEALDGVLRNLPQRAAAWALGPLVFPLGRRFAPPPDRLGHEVARVLLEGSGARDRLTAGVFVPRDPAEPLARIEDALDKAAAAEPVERRLRDAVRTGAVDALEGEALLAEGVRRKLISAEQADAVRAAEQARDEVIQVDAFERRPYTAGGSARSVPA
jgi:acyl-CoA dehydrogenase